MRIFVINVELINSLRFFFLREEHFSIGKIISLKVSRLQVKIGGYKVQRIMS